MPDQESLTLIAPKIAEVIEVFSILDALCRDRQAE
jgi:hypothetical protein